MAKYDYEITYGSTNRALVAVLSDSVGPIDLSAGGTTVTLLLRPTIGSAPTQALPMTITDAPNGEVTRDWATTAMPTSAGLYFAQYRINFADDDSTVLYVPNTGPHMLYLFRQPI